MDIIEENIESLQSLCFEYNVYKLHVFGSVLERKFSNNSDIDFLVTFKQIALNKYADNYFDFKFSLEDLFSRKIDLIEEQAVRNPFFKNTIDKSKKLVYG